MDWLTFLSKIFEVSVTSLSKIVAAAAWPVAIVWLALKFRGQVGGLLSRLTEATLPGGISTKFTPEIAQAEAVAQSIPAAPNPPAGGEEDVLKVVSRTAIDQSVVEANPTGVVMEMWLKVVGSAEDLLRSKGYGTSTKRFRLSHEVFQDLYKNDLITSEELSLVTDLRRIRNQAAHSPLERPSASDANRFRALAEKLILTWTLRETEPADVIPEDNA